MPDPSAAERAPLDSTPAEGGARAPLDQLRQLRRDVSTVIQVLNRKNHLSDDEQAQDRMLRDWERRIVAIESEVEALRAEVDRLRRRAGDAPPAPQEVRLGVIEFHSEKLNPGLIKRFSEVRDDLTAAGCIVDLWLHDIAAVLREFGYDMRIYGSKLPAASQGPAPARSTKDEQ